LIVRFSSTAWQRAAVAFSGQAFNDVRDWSSEALAQYSGAIVAGHGAGFNGSSTADLVKLY
jgi:hypothetical protein